MAAKQWSRDITHRPPATFPPEGTYTKTADEIYLIMRDPKVSPNGLASAIMMTVFYLNRAGPKLAPRQKQRIQKAIEMLRLELQYLKLATRLDLENTTAAVHPPPPKHQRIGGVNGFSEAKLQKLYSENACRLKKRRALR